MKRSRMRLAAMMGLLLAAPAGAEPREFGPSESGCPAFWPGETQDPPATYQGEFSGPGPFGTTNLRITGVGIASDGATVTATIRVLDMKRQVMPGHTRSGWEVFLSRPNSTASYKLFAQYDLASDSFAYYVDPPSGSPFAVTGSIVLGPSGGIQITAPLDHVGFAAGSVVERLRARSYAQVHYAYQSEPANGVSLYRSDVFGPEQVPLVPCPGASIEAFDAGNGDVTAFGLTLPDEADQQVTLEALRAESWVPVATGTTDETGFYIVSGSVGAGRATLRVRLDTRLVGEGTSKTISVNVA